MRSQRLHRERIYIFKDIILKLVEYGQLNETVARMSAVFKSLGLGPRDLIAAIDTNSDSFIESYYAAARAGLAFLPLNYRAKDAELEYMINTAEAKAILVGDRYLELFQRIGPRLKCKQILAYGNGAAGIPRLSALVAAA